uniref:DUF6535 domain-containing protein n=1 Tax=Psilocybe cubensis TaxID=181762 RepID=A0A8H7XR27_PSICU
MSTDDYEQEKPWELKDDFKYSPEKPEGDSWTLLGAPLMEKDEKLCKILRDEVNNLLLFAGLFSAVVTAFVVESYHNLQPDPNDDVILLLSRISESLVGGENTSSTTGNFLPSASFSPSQSAVRVNITWFTSLIFSLISVLVSIVALQWLRSHQTYFGLSPRDTLAVLNMRSEALQKWQVATIIMSLPVLLEVSVLLFFSGMVDFLISLGNTPVVIAVSTTIGLAVLFLLVTTTLPTVQTLKLRFAALHPHGTLGKRPPPSQCPYKSPQSLLFHHICCVIIHCCRYVRSWLELTHKKLCTYSITYDTVFRSTNKRPPHNQALLYHLSTTYSQETWLGIDLAWLGIRDAAEHGASLAEPDIGELDRYSLSERSLPLYDIVQGFQKAAGADYTHIFGSAVYHCFQELSYASVMTFAMKRFGLRIFRTTNTWDVISQHILDRNKYFQSLLYAGRDLSSNRHLRRMISSTDFIDFGTPEFLHVLTSNIQILHHQNLLLHLESLNSNDRYSQITSNHRKEIMIRLDKALYQRDLRLQRQVFSLPPYLKGKIFESNLPVYMPMVSQVLSLLNQYSYALTDYFKYASTASAATVTPRSLHVHADVVEFLENASWEMYRSITTFSLSRMASEDRLKVCKAFNRVIDCLSDLMQVKDLNHDTSETLSDIPISVYLLYSASIYTRRLFALTQSMLTEPGLLLTLPEDTTNKISSLLCTIDLYRSRSSIDLTTNGLAILLERKFRGVDRYGNVPRFTLEWWLFLDSNSENSNRHVGRFKAMWYEEMFHDQLKRLTSAYYTAPLRTLQNSVLVDGRRDFSTQADNFTETGSFTVQILPSV